MSDTLSAVPGMVRRVLGDDHLRYLLGRNDVGLIRQYALGAEQRQHRDLWSLDNAAGIEAMAYRWLRDMVRDGDLDHVIMQLMGEQIEAERELERRAA